MISVLIIFSSISLIYKIGQANLSTWKWITQTSLPKCCLIFGSKEDTAQKKKEQIETIQITVMIIASIRKLPLWFYKFSLIWISIIYLIPSLCVLLNFVVVLCCVCLANYFSVLNIPHWNKLRIDLWPWSVFLKPCNYGSWVIRSKKHCTKHIYSDPIVNWREFQRTAWFWDPWDSTPS